MNLSFLVSFKEWIPQRARISIALLLLTGIWLVLFVSSAVVHAEKSTENSGVMRTDFNAPIKDTKYNVDSGIRKETFIDKGDFYFLNTGTETCTAGVWGDDTCDPFAGATAEICDDLDNNCDGQTDEGLNYQLHI